LHISKHVEYLLTLLNDEHGDDEEGQEGEDGKEVERLGIGVLAAKHSSANDEPKDDRANACDCGREYPA
jgi:hypothetical protein